MIVLGRAREALAKVRSLLCVPILLLMFLFLAIAMYLCPKMIFRGKEEDFLVN